MCSESGLHVNLGLLPVKVTYFLLFAAIAVLLPYLPVYMKALGLTPTESAIILSVTTAATGIVRAIVGIVADKLRSHRLIIFVCCLIGGIFHFGILFVPPVSSEISPAHAAWNVCCNGSRLSECDGTVAGGFTASPQNASRQFQTRSCVLRCCGGSSNVIGDAASPEVNSSSCSLVMNLNISGPENCAIGSDGCKWQSLFSLNESIAVGELCQLVKNRSCSIECPDSRTLDVQSHSKFQKTFIIVFILYFIGQSGVSPIFNLLDGIVYVYLGDKHGEFGKQRLWGTISFGVFTLSTGFIMDALKQNTSRNPYLYSFIAFLILLFLTGISVYFYKNSQAPKTDGIKKNVLSTLCNFYLLVIYTVMLVAGIFSGVLEAFFFWFLNSIHAEQSVFGVSLSVSSVLEAIVLFFSGKIIVKLGSNVCLYIVFATFAFRLLANSFIEHPWIAVATEATQSICFGLLYPTVTAWGSTLVPPGMQGTVQGIMGAMYLSIGRAVGAALGGFFYEAYGPRTMFRIFSAVAAVFLIALIIILESVKWRQKHQTAENVDDADQSDNHHGSTRAEVPITCDETVEELLENIGRLNADADKQNGPNKESANLVGSDV